MKLTITIELGQGETDVLASLAALLGGAQPVVIAETTLPATAPEAPVAEEPRRRRSKKTEPVAAPAVEEETPAAFDAILAAVAPVEEVPENGGEVIVLDGDAIRNTIRNLMIDVLGIGWARKHVLGKHANLSSVPEAELPGLLVQAQADAAEVMAAAELDAAVVA